MSEQAQAVIQDTGLSAKDRRQIRSVLSRFPEIDRAVLYGSRAKGTYRPGSDIDLTLEGEGLELGGLYRLSEALSDLNLPYSFDLSIFRHIENPDFLDHIARVGIEFYDTAKFGGPVQSEAQLEAFLGNRLGELGYQKVVIRDASDLLENLRRQLEKHNAAKLTETGDPHLSDSEFAKVLNYLDKGSVFERATRLREKFFGLIRDNGRQLYINFLNTDEWCRNEYQVAQQISNEGKYRNRYDVTLLVNGLPLAQIELKRRGLEMKEAFNQINRYQRHSFDSDESRRLFQYVQLFVISNGVNTKYYANNRNQSFKQTFFWSDRNNNLITHLDDFADAFLEACQLSKIVGRYMVLHQSDKTLMVLRPYQYYAVEAIVEQVKSGRKNGYIWHTTGSGKTLTSFKAAQILQSLPKVAKVVFVVDRADLDYQTTREFNAFKPDSVDGTENTASLVKQFGDDTVPLIVTTIQKLNNAISQKRHLAAMERSANQRIVFIFDECHRSQFGDTHKKIISFFTRAQLFSFTGTPILKENAVHTDMGKRTTAELFGKCLHRYVITDAIRDENVLKFSVEYWGKLKRRDGSLIDEQVISIDKKEFFEHPDRLENIVNWVIANHDRKTHNRDFTAIMAVSNVEMLLKYYEIFKEKRGAGQHDLRVVTIFTFAANEEDKDADGLIGEPDFDLSGGNRHSREQLESCVQDYNKLYNTAHSAKDSQHFYAYYRDIAKRIKERERKDARPEDRVDILLVVNMYLTGFDAKKVNTLYVDKNLRYHGLIQAFSRTNRILNEVKSQGNIVCFRNLKAATDEAIALYSNKDAPEIILVAPYPEQIEEFNRLVADLRKIAATSEHVDDLPDEEAELAFIRTFRALIRKLNVISSFTEFDWNDLEIPHQEFEDYKGKFVDLADKAKLNTGEEKTSIINDIDFELELIRRDEINVAYILELLGELQDEQSVDSKQHNQKRKAILDLVASEPGLRSKRVLIEKFINEYMPKVKSDESIEPVFRSFWKQQRERSFAELCQQEKMNPEELDRLVDAYEFSGKPPLREDIIAALEFKPKLLERKSIVERVRQKILDLVNVFDDHTG